MKLTRVTYLVGALLVGASALATGTNILLGQAADQAMSQALAEAVRIQGMTQQITDAVSDIKVDIIQVQQFLTDISATRGLDGLDDGPSQAAAFAQRLPDDLARAKALATALDDADMAATLDRIGADFGPYYAVGQKMADAYVAGGPEAGNTLMGEFDTVAATLATSVDEMVGHISAITTKVGNDLRQREADLAGQQVLRSGIDVISHVIGIVGILALLLFTAEKFRRLRRVADVATRIAAGDLDAPRLGQSKWEELSAVFKAIGVFRDQGAELQAFQRETARQLEVAADSNGQIEAIGKSQAVIAFTPDGTILSANQNFLDTVGYGLKDIVGQKHRMFVAPEYAGSDDYRAFWDGLADGRFTSGEVRRVGKGGREIWLQATYNPIFDPQGRVTKVVKYASDITRKKITINQLSEGLHQLAQGNLGCRLDTAFDADFEPVRAAFNDTVARLNDIVGALRSTSASLKDTTADIMAGANTLSDRTTKQAAAIEETSATMEQLAATVADNARRAERASQRTTAAASEAREVGAVMQQSTEAMSHISSSSDKISNIIGVIDDIAFQTNLLALNASVEAARAGDAGKGFAVVAVEVRRLAQSAATASADIKGLIEASAQEVRTGNALVTKAYDQLAQMLTGLTECAGLVSAIASANQEQSGAIAEVSTAVREMDEVTQQNASLVETTHAAIERTEAEAAALDSIVDVFHVAAPAIDRVTTSRKRA